MKETGTLWDQRGCYGPAGPAYGGSLTGGTAQQRVGLPSAPVGLLTGNIREIEQQLGAAEILLAELLHTVGALRPPQTSGDKPASPSLVGRSVDVISRLSTLVADLRSLSESI